MFRSPCEVCELSRTPAVSGSAVLALSICGSSPSTTCTEADDEDVTVPDTDVETVAVAGPRPMPALAWNVNVCDPTVSAGIVQSSDDPIVGSFNGAPSRSKVPGAYANDGGSVTLVWNVVGEFVAVRCTE